MGFNYFPEHNTASTVPNFIKHGQLNIYKHALEQNLHIYSTVLGYMKASEIIIYFLTYISYWWPVKIMKNGM